MDSLALITLIAFIIITSICILVTVILLLIRLTSLAIKDDTANTDKKTINMPLVFLMIIIFVSMIFLTYYSEDITEFFNNPYSGLITIPAFFLIIIALVIVGIITLSRKKPSKYDPTITTPPSESLIELPKTKRKVNHKILLSMIIITTLVSIFFTFLLCFDPLSSDVELSNVLLPIFIGILIFQIPLIGAFIYRSNGKISKKPYNAFTEWILLFMDIMLVSSIVVLIFSVWLLFLTQSFQHWYLVILMILH